MKNKEIKEIKRSGKVAFGLAIEKSDPTAVSEGPLLFKGRVQKMKMILFALLLSISFSFGKRAAPVQVPAIVYTNLRIFAPPFLDNKSEATKSNERIIYLQAKDTLTDTVVWTKAIYKIIYNENEEQDIQDTFIKSMNLKGDILLLKTEENEILKINLKTEEIKVKRKNRKSKTVFFPKLVARHE